MPAHNATPGPSTLPQQPDAFQLHNSKKRGVSDHPVDEEPRSKKHRKDLEGTGVDDRSAAAVNFGNSRDNKKRRRRKKKKAPLTVSEIDQDLRVGSSAPASSSLASSTTLSLASVTPPIPIVSHSIVGGSSNRSESPSAVREGSENPPITFTDKGKGRAVSEGPDTTTLYSVAGSPQERDTMKAAQAQIAELTAQLESQKKKLSRYEDNLSHLQQSLTCEICLDLLYKPYALNPCGHIACYMCLVRWFTNVQGGVGNANIEPPTTPEDVHRLLTSPAAQHGVFSRNRKTCPLCRATMVERPVEIWSIKGMVANLVKSQLADLPSTPPPSATETPNTKPKITFQNDPWRNIFHRPRIREVHVPPRPRLQFYPPPPDHHEGEGEGGEAWGIEDMGMYDAEDGGIYRCLECMHEIWGGLCSSCHRIYPGHARFDDDDDDDDDDGGEEGENFLGRRLRQIQAHNVEWGIDFDDDGDDDDEDEELDIGDYWDHHPEPRFWGFSDDEVSISTDEMDDGELSGGEAEWSSDEAEHELAFFDALQEVREEEGIAHIEPVEDGEEAREPYHSDSASGEDSELDGHPSSDDEEEGYEDSFIDDDEEDGAAAYNARRTRQHGQSRRHSVIDLVDSEDESEGRHSDPVDTDEESLDTGAVARQLGRGMRLGGVRVDDDTEAEEPFRGRRQSPVNVEDDEDGDEDEDEEEEVYPTRLTRGNYGHRIYVDDDEDDEEEEEEEEEEVVQPRRTGLGRRQYLFVDDDDSDS